MPRRSGKNLNEEFERRSLERWRDGLSKVRVLYRARDGRLWGLPKLRKGQTPEDSIVRKPLNVRAWLIGQLGEMREAADDFDPSEAHAALRVSVQGAIEELIGQASSRALRQAAQRFEAYHLGAKMPEDDEFYPRSWMQIEDETGTTAWLTNSQQRTMTEEFLSLTGVVSPRESRRWVVLPEKGGNGVES